MPPRWYLGFIVNICLLNHFDTYVLEKADNEYILNWTEDYKNDAFTLDLKENNHDGENASRLLLFTLTPDAGETFSTWTFSKGSFTSKTVEVNGSYQFYTQQYMDYETETDHSYTLYTLLGNSQITVVITTINIDDEPPTLTATMCTMNENTDYTGTNTNCTATLSDPDGWLGNTTFQIVNSNANAETYLEKEDELFTFYFDKDIAANVYSTTVYLNTLPPNQLDYETKIFYSFTVQAKDGAGHSTTPNADVTCIVDVGDLNDMPPEWTDYFNTMQITEKTDYSFTVTAIDGDRYINADIIYFLVASDDGGDYCNGSCVNITTQGKKGNITVKPIDRDTNDISTYKFDIMAQETDEPPYTVNLNITFFLEDLDDHSPVFLYVNRTNDTSFDVKNEDKKIVQFTFYENFAGAIDGNIGIQDLDTGENAQFSVELQENEERLHSDVSYTDAFLVVPTAGYKNGIFTINVKNSTYLDFENEPWQNITFYIHSSGTLNSSNEDYLLVNINLLDYNDELPIFKNSSYAVSVKENIKKGEEIITVKATDRDAEDAVLKHSLVGASTIIDAMAIDSAEGIITVAGENYVFDYDRINPVIFQIEAVDKADHVTTVPVTINLIDVNNKAPTYVVEDIIQVEENQVIGIALNATITASDVDTDRNLTAEINWDRSYARKNSQMLPTSANNTKAMQFLDLTYEQTSTDTISITLYVSNNNANQTAPDYETFDTLYLSINITDLNTLVPEFESKKSTEALVIVNIIDINDNPPIFTDQSKAKNRTIYEESPINTIVGTIEATDLDVGDEVEYTCTYVNETLDWFECDSSGQITAKTANIDADTGPVYNVSINCTATDGFWTTWHVFDIYILDTNNKEPQIRVNDSLPSAAVVEIQEQSPIGTFVTTVPAPDADRDVPYHTVQCRLNQGEECYNSFELDYEIFEIRVKVGGSDLDRDTKKANYTCTLTCTDNPNNEQNGGQKSDTTSFVIKLLDINNHCPEMKTSELETIEALKEGDLIGKIEAEDLDEGINADIIMEIETVTKLEDDGNITDYTDDELFRMEKHDDYYINATRKQWHMVANKTLRDYYGQYVIQLRLTDEGIEPQSTDDENNFEEKEKAKLTLTIGKFNYYPPVFVFPTISGQNFSLTADQESGTQLAMYYQNQTFADIEISDGGDNLCLEKWNPTFDVALLDMASSVRNFFVMEKTGRCTAQLQVDDSYNKDYAVNIVAFKLRLSVSLDDKDASDGEANYTEITNITLNFIDINVDPIFNQDLGQWNISFLEDDASQIQELPDDRKASYPNIDNSSDLPKYYFLDSTDEDVLETFEIEVDSGTIKLQKKLDYLERTFYTFDVLAGKNQSIGSDKSASKMTVNVTVIDINNHVPQWTESSFYGAILSTTEKGSTVVTLNATDLDTIDQGNLEYFLNGTIESVGSDNLHNVVEPFLLDKSTGVITLNFKVEVNMNGYFTFWVKVQDHEDDYGNGPFENTTVVNITIITSDNTVTFKFENTLDTVVEQKAQVLETISSNLGWSCHFKDIAKYSQNGVQLDNVTAADIYCIDGNNNLLTADDMKTKLNNINTYQQLKQKLLSYGILLQTFESGETAIDNLENTLKIALISVSVVLGAACIILGVTFVFKIKELQNRLEKLTRQDFGSDESAVNRNGINNIPTSNLFAVEGANPIFNIQMDKDVIKDDVLSIRSGNSDLIGVEDNPEFDEMFGKEKF